MPTPSILRLLFVAIILAITPTLTLAQSPTYPQPPKHGNVYVVAHRGAHNGIPENSLPAYQKAIDLGADFIEIDIRTTKDGKFVSIHNDTIDAYVSGATGKVADLTLAQLRELDIGTRIAPRWQGTRIPTFEEVLTLSKGKIGIYLDLKDAPVKDLLPIIKSHDMESEIIWYANRKHLQELSQLSPKSIPMPDPGPEKNLPRLIKQFHPTIIAATWKNYSPSFVKICHEAGSLVIVDESDPTCWEDALAWGSDGIQTDHPEKLINFLSNR